MKFFIKLKKIPKPKVLYFTVNVLKTYVPKNLSQKDKKQKKSVERPKYTSLRV